MILLKKATKSNMPKMIKRTEKMNNWGGIFFLGDKNLFQTAMLITRPDRQYIATCPYILKNSSMNPIEDKFASPNIAA
jgi:hypothetical protein